MTFDLDLWPFDHMNIWRFPYYINKPSLVPVGLQLFIWGNFTFSAYLTTWPYMAFDLDMWPFDLINKWVFPCYIHKPSLVPIGLQLFNWGQFYIFSLSYNLTSYDLWPWYVTFDLINKWEFPCCTYDSSLFEIHQSMQKLQANVNPFSQQTTTTSTDNNYNNSGQSK